MDLQCSIFYNFNLLDIFQNRLIDILVRECSHIMSLIWGLGQGVYQMLTCDDKGEGFPDH